MVARCVRVAGEWPYVVAASRVLDRAGGLIASSRATFVGLVAGGPRHLEPRTGRVERATGEGPRLDVVAGALDADVAGSWRGQHPGAETSRLRVLSVHRNRFGPMHGGVIYTGLAGMALRSASAGTLGGCIVDSHVRFLRPILDDEVLLEATTTRRSSRLVDLDVTMSSPSGERLALGRFLVSPDG